LCPRLQAHVQKSTSSFHTSFHQIHYRDTVSQLSANL
jgi:hypothetical protein